jgi:hypothetical protein
MTTNFESLTDSEALTMTDETPVEVAEEAVVEKKPEPEKQPVELKKPEPYVRPAVALPKREISRHPRNVPRYR